MSLLMIMAISFLLGSIGIILGEHWAVLQKLPVQSKRST